MGTRRRFSAEFLSVIGPLDDVVVVALPLRYAARRIPATLCRRHGQPSSASSTGSSAIGRRAARPAVKILPATLDPRPALPVTVPGAGPLRPAPVGGVCGPVTRRQGCSRSAPLRCAPRLRLAPAPGVPLDLGPPLRRWAFQRAQAAGLPSGTPSRWCRRAAAPRRARPARPPRPARLDPCRERRHRRSRKLRRARSRHHPPPRRWRLGRRATRGLARQRPLLPRRHPAAQRLPDPRRLLRAAIGTPEDRLRIVTEADRSVTTLSGQASTDALLASAPGVRLDPAVLVTDAEVDVDGFVDEVGLAGSLGSESSGEGEGTGTEATPTGSPSLPRCRS